MESWKTAPNPHFKLGKDIMYYVVKERQTDLFVQRTYKRTVLENLSRFV